SMGGEKGCGRTIPPVNRREVLPPACLPSLSCGAMACAARVSSHGSQASPMPSPSVSTWSALATVGQLSIASQRPSLSGSGEVSSAGQVALDPVQLSSGSQGPVEGRQTNVLGWKPSGGHSATEPSQV